MKFSFEEDPTLPFVGLNALEIAAVVDAKKFLSQSVVQSIVNSIWYIQIISHVRFCFVDSIALPKYMLNYY